MMGMYILAEDGKTPVATDDIRVWGAFDRRASQKYDEVAPNIFVSTVFLGLDHSWYGGPPILWETMIFGGAHDQWQDRYTSYDEAMIGHEAAKLFALTEVTDEGI